MSGTPLCKSVAVQFMRPLVGTLVLAITSFFHCSGQVVDPITAQQEPVPGAGHHYIGMGVETVNPADGSVSFDLPIQTPTGRGLSFPFGIHFNSSEPFYIANSGLGAVTGVTAYWITPTISDALTAPPFTLNGWSYQLPRYSAAAFISYTEPAQSGGCGNPYSGGGCNTTDFCWATQGYNFSGLDGSSHVLYLANTWLDPSSPDLTALPTLCGQPELSNGGAVGLQTTFGSPTAGTNTNTQPTLTVTDQSGTIYNFGQGPAFSISPSTVGSATFGALAQTITDRNGNQMKLNGTSAVSGGTTLLPSGSYTDTADRLVVAWSGLGSSSGDQLTISGLPKPIAVKWETISVTLPTNSVFAFGQPTSVTSCEITSSALSMSVVSEIDLPNGQKYRFEYGGTYGLLNRIIFPDGGYVRYLWGPNKTSKATYQTWAPSGSGTYTGYWDCWAEVDTPAITDRFVSYDGSSEVLHQQFTYNTKWVTNDPNQLYWSSKQSSVTSTDFVTGQVTVTNYYYNSVAPYLGPNDGPKALKPSPVGCACVQWINWQSAQIPVESQVVYQDDSNKTYKTVNKSWFDQYTMVGDQTILDNGQGITTLRCPDQYDRILATYEYNFQSAGAKPNDPACAEQPTSGSTLSAGLNASAFGPLLRQTTTAYHNFGSGAYILDEPDNVTEFDGSGNQVKQTSYLYDQTAVSTSGSSTITGLVSPPGTRGNPTSVSRWLNTSPTPLTTTYAYFTTGQVMSMTDPCGTTVCSDIALQNHTTTFSYLDSFLNGTGTPPSGQTNAYLTQVTYPNTGRAHQEFYVWGYTDGLLRTRIDQNSNPTTYQYADPLLRLTKVVGPPDPNNGNQNPTTSYTYVDWTSAQPSPSTIAKSVLQNTSETLISSNSIFDGMGHVIRTQMTTDPSGADLVDTVYEGLGPVYTVSNLYRSTSEDTYGLTTYGYDPLGRKISQVDSDGISTKIWDYIGPTTIYTDEDKHQWQSTTDALDRLVKVLEPSGLSLEATLETDYGYDTLDDLTSVNQCGGTCPSSGTVARSFTYDSLSRLVQSYNPEAGWVCYGTTGGATPNGNNCTSGYDANSNLAFKTDARGITTNYSFDNLNRVLSKSYSHDASKTPFSCFQYDLSSISNADGRLTNEWTQSNSAGACATSPPTSGLWSKHSILAYDVVGRITSEQQCTPSNCTSGTPYTPTYSYDLAGNHIASTNGITSTPTVNTLSFTQAFDAANHLLTVTSNWLDGTHPATLFSAQTGTTLPCMNSTSPSYTAFGSLMNASFGSALTLNRSFDNRLRTTCEIDTGGVLATATGASATLTVTGAEQSK